MRSRDRGDGNDDVEWVAGGGSGVEQLDPRFQVCLP
jgi:hypothetical protein